MSRARNLCCNLGGQRSTFEPLDMELNGISVLFTLLNNKKAFTSKQGGCFHNCPLFATQNQFLFSAMHEFPQTCCAPSPAVSSFIQTNYHPLVVSTSAVHVMAPLIHVYTLYTLRYGAHMRK